MSTTTANSTNGANYDKTTGQGPVDESNWLDPYLTSLGYGMEQLTKAAAGGEEEFQDLVKSLPGITKDLIFGAAETFGTGIADCLGITNLLNGNYAYHDEHLRPWLIIHILEVVLC